MTRRPSEILLSKPAVHHGDAGKIIETDRTIFVQERAVSHVQAGHKQ
jgi:hypothetical protein